jgi:hypothetical protein
MAPTYLTVSITYESMEWMWTAEMARLAIQIYMERNELRSKVATRQYRLSRKLLQAAMELPAERSCVDQGRIDFHIITTGWGFELLRGWRSALGTLRKIQTTLEIPSVTAEEAAVLNRLCVPSLDDSNPSSLLLEYDTTTIMDMKP